MECFHGFWSRRLNEGDTSAPWIFGGVKSSLLSTTICKSTNDSNYFQEIIQENMENDLREILREKAEKHHEYYSSIIGSDKTSPTRSVPRQTMAQEVPQQNVLTSEAGSTGSSDRKSRTRRRGVYEIEGMLTESTEFKSVKVLRENYIAMLEKTSRQLSRINEDTKLPDNIFKKTKDILSISEQLETDKTLYGSTGNSDEIVFERSSQIVEISEEKLEKSELLVPPSSGYCSSTASGASDDEREKNWKKVGRRSGSSDSAVHSDEEGPITSNWGEKQEEILSKEGYQTRSPYSPRCSVDHTNVPSKTIIEAHYVPLPIDRKFSVDIISEHSSNTFDDSRRQSCFSEGEDQPRYRYWRTPSVVVSDYSDDILGLTLEDIEYIRSRRGNSISPDSSLHSSCSNLNYCGSSISGLDGDYVLFQPYRKSSNCSTCSTLSDEEEPTDTLQQKKEVS